MATVDDDSNCLDSVLHGPPMADKIVSPWHDIPLFCGDSGYLNYVCEIPKETRAKMEAATVSTSQIYVDHDHGLSDPGLPCSFWSRFCTACVFLSSLLCLNAA